MCVDNVVTPPIDFHVQFSFIVVAINLLKFGGFNVLKIVLAAIYLYLYERSPFTTTRYLLFCNAL